MKSKIGHEAYFNDTVHAYAGASELVAFVHALHKAIWIDNVNAIPPEQISEDEVVYATDLYPDITPVSIHDFYRSQQ